MSARQPHPRDGAPARDAPVPARPGPEGATVTVERITEEAEADRKLLEHLWRNGVRPDTQLTIQEIAPWAGTITTVTDGRTVVLGLAAAAKIWVYKPKGPPAVARPARPAP